MAALEVIALNKTVPQLMAPQVGDTYSFPRVAEFLAGAVGAPSIAFSGDANTGIWSPAADTVAASVNGVERLRLTTSGLGVNTTAPAAWLHVAAPGTGAGTGEVIAETIGANGNAGYAFRTAGVTRWAITLIGTDGSNSLRFRDENAAATRMTLDAAGNLGLGVAPSTNWTSAFRVLEFANSAHFAGEVSVPGLYLGANYVDTGSGFLYKTSAAASTYRQTVGEHRWSVAPSGTAGAAVTFTRVMTLDNAGNLGLAVTPSAWGGQFGSGTLELRNGSALYAYNGAIQVGLSNNCFFNGTNWIYKNSGFALRYQQTGAAGFGTHEWLVAGSGTQNAQVTFTQAMTLDASGNLALGATSASGFRARVAAAAADADVVRWENSAGTVYGVLGVNTTGSVLYAGAATNHDFALIANNVARARVKTGGQVRFVPLAAAPTTNVEDGDVYYNSGTNKLQVRAGGVWVDLH